MVLWVTSAPAAVRWDGVFLSTDYANSLRVETSPSNPTSIALSSGGNVGIASSSTGTIRLQQSVIGQAAGVTPGIVDFDVGIGSRAPEGVVSATPRSPTKPAITVGSWASRGTSGFQAWSIR
jgi:hypothetical protein